MPRLMNDTEKRTVALKISLTPSQARLLEKDAKRLGRPLSDVAGLYVAERLATQPAAN